MAAEGQTPKLRRSEGSGELRKPHQCATRGASGVSFTNGTPGARTSTLCADSAPVGARDRLRLPRPPLRVDAGPGRWLDMLGNALMRTTISSVYEIV